MPGESEQARTTFRAGMSLWIMVGLATFFFGGLCLVLAVQRDDWQLLLGAGAAFGFWFLLIAYLKIQFTASGFVYRNLSMNRSVEYDQIEKAYYDAVNMNGALTAPRFWIRLKTGKSFKINLKTFPIRAAATLFQALDDHEIPIETPEISAVQAEIIQIRREQAKLNSGERQ